MNRFEELIQLQLKLAEEMIHAKTEIQNLENDVAHNFDRTVLYERKQRLLQMEDDFNNLINEVIVTFEKTSV